MYNEAAVRTHQSIAALLQLCDSLNEVVIALLQLMDALLCTCFHWHQDTWNIFKRSSPRVTTTQLFSSFVGWRMISLQNLRNDHHKKHAITDGTPASCDSFLSLFLQFWIFNKYLHLEWTLLLRLFLVWLLLLYIIDWFYFIIIQLIILIINFNDF